jgi:hypothetical protein
MKLLKKELEIKFYGSFLDAKQKWWNVVNDQLGISQTSGLNSIPIAFEKAYFVLRVGLTNELGELIRAMRSMKDLHGA